MLGLDELIVDLGHDGGLLIAVLVAAVLGLRHATDPDHLTTVATLVVSDTRGARRAGLLGACWGAGHAVTLIALGIPAILWSDALPAGARRVAELLVGALIVGLAVRLLLRWRRGYFHVHEHEHGPGAEHSHPHFHEHAPDVPHPREHEHRHARHRGLGRTPAAAFGIGLLHGAGGSAGAGILLVSAIPGRGTAAAALLLFAAGSALAMAAASYGFGSRLSRPALRRRVNAMAPGFGAAGMAFGVWYGLAALDAAPYPF
jgi:ABC-type nickel/cobalt efflux system permease component RcnA